MEQFEEQLRRLSASTLPDGSRHAVEQNGLLYKKNVITDKSELIHSMRYDN